MYHRLSSYGKIVCFLGIFLIIISIQKKWLTSDPNQIEGFELNQSFLNLDDFQEYDSFYASIYDYLMLDKDKNQFELLTFFQQTNPSSESIILDIGSGTGHHVNMFQKTFQCKAIGLDNSESMVLQSQSLFPDSTFTKGDGLNKNQYSSGQFTHITCLYYTIYMTKDKHQLISNIYRWLMNGGYFVVHLVNRDKIVSTLPTKYVNHNYNYNFKTKIDFNKFKYNSVFIPHVSDNKAVIRESFTFDSGEKRKQEQILYFDDHESILQIARSVGFLVHSKIHMDVCNYENNYLYVLQKPL